jgi:putative alpha-1,2-mannosidase
MEMNELQMFLYVCIISADNDEFDLTEEDKQEIMRRRDENLPWEEVFKPIKDEETREKLVKIFNKKD